MLILYVSFQIVLSRVSNITQIAAKLKVVMRLFMCNHGVLVFVSQGTLAALERPCLIMQGHVSLQARDRSKSEVARFTAMLSFQPGFVGVKMALQVAHVPEQFPTELTRYRLFHFRVFFHDMHLEMMLGPNCITTFGTHKVLYTRVNA